MQWLLAIVLIIAMPIVAVAYWRRKNRAFRAEVSIECLRLWRKMVEDYRQKNPPDSITAGMSVAEEAAYMALHSEHRQKVLTMAWDNVKKMTKYLVQECNMGKAVGGWQEIFANSELEAAQKVVSGELRRAGKLGELRVRVRVASDTKTETDFYADN